MTDLAQQLAGRPGRAIDEVPKVRGVRGVVPPPASIERSGDSGRAAARAELDAALRGVELTATDRRFLARLSQWDKRTATTVASLVSRARQRGRREAALSARQLEVVLAALIDAVEYRTSGAASAGCWDCASLASGLCAEHDRDADRARSFAELAAVLCGQAAAKNGTATVSQARSVAASGCARVARGSAQNGSKPHPGQADGAKVTVPELSLCGKDD